MDSDANLLGKEVWVEGEGRGKKGGDSPGSQKIFFSVLNSCTDHCAEIRNSVQNRAYDMGREFFSVQNSAEIDFLC